MSQINIKKCKKNKIVRLHVTDVDSNVSLVAKISYNLQPFIFTILSVVFTLRFKLKK